MAHTIGLDSRTIVVALAPEGVQGRVGQAIEELQKVRGFLSAAVTLVARLERARTKPACPFIAGFVAGWTNRALGTELEFEETKCVARGDNRCLFESVEFMRPKQEYVE